MWFGRPTDGGSGGLGFSPGFAVVAGGADGPEVVVGAGAALGDGSDVVDLGGLAGATWQLEVAAVVVSFEDAPVLALLVPSADADCPELGFAGRAGPGHFLRLPFLPPFLPAMELEMAAAFDLLMPLRFRAS